MITEFSQLLELVVLVTACVGLLIILFRGSSQLGFFVQLTAPGAFLLAVLYAPLAVAAVVILAPGYKWVALIMWAITVLSSAAVAIIDKINGEN